MHKLFKIFVLALGAIGVVLWLLLLGSVDPYTNLMFYVAYILLAIAVIAVVVYSIINLLAHPKKLKMTAIYGFALLVIVGISYALAKGDDVPGVDAFTSKIVGTGLYTFYLLLVVTVLTMVASSIKKLTNK